MLEFFKELSLPVKIATVLMGVALVAALAFFANRPVSSGVPEEYESAPRPNATEPGNQPSTEVPQRPTATVAPEARSDNYKEPSKTTEVPAEEQVAAQDVANEGFLQFYQSQPDETVEARTARLNPYFAPDAPSLTELPLGGPLQENAELEVASEASINFSEPIGGDLSRFEILIGATVRGQINPPEEIDEIPIINESSMVMFTVTMVRTDQGWKVFEIVEE